MRRLRQECADPAVGLGEQVDKHAKALAGSL
jgi:hypothetical protein